MNAFCFTFRKSSFKCSLAKKSTFLKILWLINEAYHRQIKCIVKVKKLILLDFQVQSNDFGDNTHRTHRWAGFQIVEHRFRHSIYVRFIFQHEINLETNKLRSARHDDETTTDWHTLFLITYVSNERVSIVCRRYIQLTTTNTHIAHTTSQYRTHIRDERCVIFHSVSIWMFKLPCRLRPEHNLIVRLWQ